MIEQVAWLRSIGNTMTNFRDLGKPTNKTWQWMPTLRDEFKKAKEEIITRVKDGVKMCDKNVNSQVFEKSFQTDSPCRSQT